MKKLRIALFLFLIGGSVLLSGCWDRTKIEERAYVVALGLDKGKENNQIKITYLIQNPELSKQEGAGGEEPPQEIISFQANDFIAARNTANTIIAKEISYNLLSAIIVSEDLAKDKTFLRYIYDATKDREFKRNIPMIVSREGAEKFIEDNNPKLEARLNKYLELILKYGNESGLIPDSDLHTFFRITEADAELFLAIYGSTKLDEKDKQTEEDNFLPGELEVEGKTNKTQLIGSAIFKEGKMIGKLTGDETRIAILINDYLEMGEILATYPDPFHDNYRITIRIMKKENNDVKMDLKRKIPTIDVTIPIYIDILSDHSMIDYKNDSEKRHQLIKSIKETLDEKLNKFVKKTQKDYKGEPFGWSLMARREFLSIPEYEEYDWMKQYPNMKVNISVDITLGKFGRQGEVPNMREVRD